LTGPTVGTGGATTVLPPSPVPTSTLLYVLRDAPLTTYLNDFTVQLCGGAPGPIPPLSYSYSVTPTPSTTVASFAHLSSGGFKIEVWTDDLQSVGTYTLSLKAQIPTGEFA